ncbi:MAG: phage tail spike protein [Acutalibacteraceae bacterium]
MIVYVYADDNLIYSNTLADSLPLIKLVATTEINGGGSATLSMPYNNPYYESFICYKTIITIYKDDVIVFRGRVLYKEYEFNKNLVVTCEGEKCFLNDSIVRPYLFTDSPEIIFTDLINSHNTQVDVSKQFKVGTITVTDLNDYVRIESSYADQTLSVLNKLVESCGGYVTFTTDSEGNRCINYLAELPYVNSQNIEFTQNLINLNVVEEKADIITRLIPYGAIIEGTEDRLTIESVNDGIDYIQDDEAVSLRGCITKAVYWDDVTTPLILLHKAQAYLNNCKKIVASIQLDAIDLSYVDSNYDSFMVGDKIHVISVPHGIDDDFVLYSKTEDFLNPKANTICLNKDISTLTGLSAVEKSKQNSELHQTAAAIRADYKLNIENSSESIKNVLTSLIQQTSDSIMSEVVEQYITADKAESIISTRITQLSDSIEIMFNNLQQTVDDNDASTREQFSTASKYIRFENGNIILGVNENELILKQQNDRISFLDSGVEVAYFSNKRLVVTDAEFFKSLQIGNFAFIPRKNGNLSFVKVG